MTKAIELSQLGNVLTVTEGTGGVAKFAGDIVSGTAPGTGTGVQIHDSGRIDIQKTGGTSSNNLLVLKNGDSNEVAVIDGVGSIDVAGPIGNGEATTGVSLGAYGQVVAQRASGSGIWSGFQTGTGGHTSRIYGSGAAEFAADLFSIASTGDTRIGTDNITISGTATRSKVHIDPGGWIGSGNVYPPCVAVYAPINAADAKNVWVCYDDAGTGTSSYITAGGAATFAGSITTNGNLQVDGYVNTSSYFTTGNTLTNGTGCYVGSTGIYARNDTDSDYVFRGFNGGLSTSNIKSEIFADGRANFDGRVNVGYDGGLATYAGSGLSAYTSHATAPTIYAQNANASGKVWQAYNATSETSYITSAGAATFLGKIETGTGSTSYGVEANSGSATSTYASVSARNFVTGGNVWQGKNASSGTQTSKITESGAATFAGAVKIGGTAAANEIDEYEEGTWTIALQDTAGNAISSSASSGHYTKIGNLVYCIFAIQVSNTNSAGNNLEIHGLPFACENVTVGGGEPSFGGLTFANNLVSTDLGGGIILRVNNATSYVECKYTPGGAQTGIGQSAWNTSNISSSTYMTGSFQYRT